MVSAEDMAAIALRYDTVVSRAMLRACGVPVPHARPRIGSIVAAAVFDGMTECFANRESPMDRMP